MEQNPGKLISTILRHDRKVTTYKLALIRAINDVVLSFPDLTISAHDIAIPLPLLASYWVAYYWPFVSPTDPIYQGQRAVKVNQGHRASDIDFRGELTALRLEWEALTNPSSSSSSGSSSRPSDGFFLVSELRVPRKRKLYPATLVEAFDRLIKKIARTLENPIRYAGPVGKEWSVFEKPLTLELAKFTRLITTVPTTTPQTRCLILPSVLYRGFLELSLWIEALCIHEWCLFTEKISQSQFEIPHTVQGQAQGQGQAKRTRSRGEIYTLLTDRPDNRRPLSWERNQIEILLLEGREFICPWTHKKIVHNTRYDLDHIIPVSIYPTNELWNLVPADPRFNQQTKKERMPSSERVQKAYEPVVLAYTHYHSSKSLAKVLEQDTAIRFSFSDEVKFGRADFARRLATVSLNFTRQIAEARNLAEF